MKNNKKRKEKSKYGLLSNVVFLYKQIWTYDKFIVLSGLLLIPIKLMVQAISVYLPSYVTSLFTKFDNFNQIIIGILLILLLQLIIEIIAVMINEKNASSDLITLTKFKYKVTEKNYNLDYFLTLQKENEDKATYAEKAVENNHTATVNLLVRFSMIVYRILAFILFGALVSTINPIILVIIILGAIVNYLMLKWEKNRNAKTWKKRAITNKKMNYLAYDLTRNYNCGKDIRLFSLSSYFTKLMKKLIKNSIDEHKETNRRSFIVSFISFLMVLLRDGLAYYYLIKLVLNNGIDVSQFILQFGAVTALSELISEIINSFGEIYEGSIQTSYYREYLDISNVLKDEGGLEVDLKQPYSIEFKNVSFKYPKAEKYTLENINIKIEKGEKIAIVGLNGAGKTTMTMLMCGLLLPTQGEILLNDHNILEYNKNALYSLFSFVPQQFSLLPTTIVDNICFNKVINEERLEECLKLSELYDKVMSLPNKEQTHVNKRVYSDGIELSGGEKQKLMLARAIYKEHSILILDEPTSALDPIAESEMYQKYNDISKSSTTIFISHRLASTKFCDRIILIKDSQIKELGSHEQLMNLNGEYKSLFEVQSKYYKEDYTNEEE